ncbi:ABC transporter permease [Nocardiopsis sp. L17-MgMaSL7]|uniref:ABC transporter permease n=1 Tax=Nocardiopsis sp. L17-MgMaSL7 TaxID=1938893 RepID=UPI000D71467B|nr:ABC transporter permease [Nocardiopsis sp. L17-MgMaSL7]PWV57409.1 MacB-like protein [Nocardiopsis sp. L17-MgMaSL7]
MNDAITLAVAVASPLALIALVALSARGRLSVRIAARNVWRRPGQTVLVAMGLSLAALLFSASFTLESALHQAMRAQQTADLGGVDAVVTPDGSGVGTDDEDDRRDSDDPDDEPPMLERDDVRAIEEALDDPDTTVSSMLTLRLPVAHERADRGDPGLTVLGAANTDGAIQLVDGDGEEIARGGLSENDVLLSSEASRELRAERGDTVEVAGRQTRVVGVYEAGAPLTPPESAVVPLSALQRTADLTGRVNTVTLSYGEEVTWEEAEDPVRTDLSSLVEDNGWQAEPLRASAHDSADRLTTDLATLFLLFSQLSMVAGVLLIVLVVMMLAGERRQEFGVLRAMGMKRARLGLVLTVEGLGYAVLASAAGTAAGWFAGAAASRVLSDRVADPAMPAPALEFGFDPVAMATAYLIGVGVITVVFTFAAVRASKVDIVSALRGSEAPSRRRWWSVPLLALILLLGLATVALGVQNGTATETLTGLTLAVGGLGALLPRLRVPRRLAHSLCAAVIIVLWSVPGELFGDTGSGITLFFLAGMALVAAGVWLFVANSDLVQRFLRRVLAPLPSMTSVVPISVAYSVRNRVQAGMTIAMLSIVVLTITLSGFVTAAVNQVYSDHRSVTGGFDVRAEWVAAQGEPPALRQVLEESPRVDTAKVARLGGYEEITTEARQVDTDADAEEVRVWGADDDYLLGNRYPVFLRADGLDTSEEVWDELRRTPNTAVVSAAMIPSDSAAFVGGGSDLELEGVDILDDSLPANLRLEVTEPDGESTTTLRVIGVVDRSAEYLGDVVTSSEGMSRVTGEDSVPGNWFIRAQDRDEVGKLEIAVQRALMEHGVATAPMQEEVEFRASSNGVVQWLLMAFMGFGLVVGCAALGVVSIRSISERRNQIGVLRAIGMQISGVRRLFLIESLVITVSGIALGVGLGFAVSPGLVDSLRVDLPGVVYTVPVSVLVGVVGVTLVFSMVVSVLTSRRAGEVPPAEALRGQS